MCAFLLAAAAPGVAQDALRISTLNSNNQVVVSFELTGAYDDSVRDAIASGLRTTFTYTLELRTPAWIDRTIGTTIVTMTDQYDNLTRRHTLTRTIDGRVDDELVTEDSAVVKTWLTKLSRVPVADAVSSSLLTLSLQELPEQLSIVRASIAASAHPVAEVREAADEVVTDANL